jgi:ribosomal protein S18 acetylase RimI-like enzyme
MTYLIKDQWLSNILSKETYSIKFPKKGTGAAQKELESLLNKKDLFIYAKVNPQDVYLIRFLEKNKFSFIDTTLLFKKRWEKVNLFKVKGNCRLSYPQDEERVIDIARKSFIYSRFHRDAHIKKKRADNLKAEWAKTYFKGTRGEALIVAEEKGNIIGFLLLLKGKEEKTLIMDLIAVEEKYRKQGIAQGLIYYAQKYFAEKYNCWKVGTQLVNTPAAALYNSLGFKLSEAQYIFHLHSE